MRKSTIAFFLFLAGFASPHLRGDEVPDRVSCSAESPDRKTRAVVGPPRATSNGSLYLVDVASGKARRIEEHSPFITEVRFSPDSTLLLADSGDGKTIAVYNVQKGTKLHEFPILEVGLGSRVAVSPDSKLIALVVEEKLVVVRDLASGKVVFEVKKPFREVAFNDKGTSIKLKDKDGNQTEEALK